jgi:hypothetical protein
MKYICISSLLIKVEVQKKFVDRKLSKIKIFNKNLVDSLAFLMNLCKFFFRIILFFDKIFCLVKQKQWLYIFFEFFTQFPIIERFKLIFLTTLSYFNLYLKMSQFQLDNALGDFDHIAKTSRWRWKVILVGELFLFFELFNFSLILALSNGWREIWLNWRKVLDDTNRMQKNPRALRLLVAAISRANPSSQLD